MADSKRCERTDPHEYHGWTEPSPTGTTWHHVCVGIIPIRHLPDDEGHCLVDGEDWPCKEASV